MRKSVLALLLACVCMPAFAQQEVQVPDLDQPTGVCADCDPGDPGDGGGGGPPPPPPPPPAPKINLAKVDASQGTITIQLTNGSTWVIDEDLNKLFISSSTHSAELNLDSTLLQWAGGNQTNANQLRARIHTLATSNINTNTLVRGAPVQGLMMGLPGGQSWNCYFSSFYCDIRPVNDFGGGGGTFSYAFYAPPGAGGGDTPDRRYWEHFRDLACGAQTDAAQQMVFAVVGAIVACPFFETGLGALACGAAGMTIIDGYDDYQDNAQMCMAPYPGPNNW